MGAPHVKQSWQEVPAHWFRWHVVVSVPWRTTTDHINVCEARGRCLALRARARQSSLQRSRFLHLLDSQVNLHQASKGRTSSLKMAHILKKSCAVLLGTGMRDINGYTRSDQNPADKASRDLARWKRFKMQSKVHHGTSKHVKKARTPQAAARHSEGAWPRP